MRHWGVLQLRAATVGIAAFALAGCGVGIAAPDAPSSNPPTRATPTATSAPGEVGDSPSASGSKTATPVDPTLPRVDPTRPVGPTPLPRSPFSGEVEPRSKVIYLTFDDGPWEGTTRQLLKILDRYDAKATFFMVGEMARALPHLVREVRAGGHAIGNHTYHHADLTKLDDEGIRRELRSAAKPLGPGLGPCMRPPYGETNNRVRAVVRSEGYRTYLWTVWANDWDRPPAATMVSHLRKVTKNKSNVLLHDGGGPRENTVEAVRRLLPEWIAKGYTFRALPGCLNLEQHGP